MYFMRLCADSVFTEEIGQEGCFEIIPREAKRTGLTMARILVIDDEHRVRQMLRDMLTGAGYEVVEAESSEDGIRLFRQAPTDVVITDIFMPTEGGLEVIRELTSQYPDVKIIAISGVRIMDELDIVSLSKRYGALYAFEKPFGKKEMLEAVETLLAGD